MVYLKRHVHQAEQIFQQYSDSRIWKFVLIGQEKLLKKMR